MPCESCHVQFTVFRRKRSCADCKRFYCSNCLTGAKLRGTNSNASLATGTLSSIQLCTRCMIFAKRPLLRTDLLQLKPKDLIFYLQSKHISTTGCVEKDELVGLVLSHVHQTEDGGTAAGAGSARSSYAEPSSNSFDSLKQTCQNFFTSITENISDSLSSFDNKATVPKAGARDEARSDRNSTDSGSMHIFDQPRVSTREIPSYASYQQQSFTYTNNNSYNVTQLPTTTTTPTVRTPSTVANITSPGTLLSSSGSSSVQSPVSPEISISSIDRALSVGTQLVSASPSASVTPHLGLPRRQDIDISDCECSDEELMASFSEHSLARKNNETQSNKEASKYLETDERTGNKSRASTDINGAEMSSHSSFEELGAIGGGTSDESKATTDTNSTNTEQWQILDNAVPQTTATTITEQSLAAERGVPEASSNDVSDNNNATNNNDKTAIATIKESALQVAIPSPQQKQQHQDQTATLPPTVPLRVKKVTRRRSESYLVNRLRQRPNSEDDSPTGNYAPRNIASTLHEQDDTSESAAVENGATPKRVVASCQRCGKHKATLRNQVEKMRRHLESAQLPEAEIKQELQNFLSYLEQRSKSIECSDTETVVSSLNGRYCGQSPEHGNMGQTEQEQLAGMWAGGASFPADWEFQLDDNEGIYVYAGGTNSEANEYNGQPSRFINLEDYDTIDDLESLSVKQLKEILMLNRVDYKGCCEKQELLDRVQRLWKNLKSAPAVEKLPTDELCKICMDAPIECVILECGHMATCTNCGKVLSECPICRQYIVRVVRFFRA